MCDIDNDDIDRMDRWYRGQLAETVKRLLRWKINEGQIKRQCASDFASAALGKKVTILEDLTEAELTQLRSTLNGGNRRV